MYVGSILQEKYNKILNLNLATSSSDQNIIVSTEKHYKNEIMQNSLNFEIYLISAKGWSAELIFASLLVLA